MTYPVPGSAPGLAVGALQLQGRRALVTGASSGIGAACARVLAGQGVHVALAARSQDKLEQLAHEQADRGVHAVAIPVDLSVSGGPEAAVERAAASLGGLDILVNSAGGSVSGTTLQVADEDWVGYLNLKLLGYVRCARAAARVMDGGGAIVNVIGGSGRRPRGGSVVTSVANAALLAFTEAFAQEVADRGIRVVGVNPGITDTPLLDRMVAERAHLTGQKPEEIREGYRRSALLGRLTTPEEVATYIAFLASPLAAVVSGTTADMGHSAR